MSDRAPTHQMAVEVLILNDDGTVKTFDTAKFQVGDGYPREVTMTLGGVRLRIVGNIQPLEPRE